MTLAANAFDAWLGRQETLHDHLGATPVRALAATLDLPTQDAAPGTPLPPLWHWLYFLPMHARRDIGPDGHARRGGFMPPVPLPRRMWAGSQFEFHAPLRVGDDAERCSTIQSVAVKQGRSGPLVFVKVRHELRSAGAASPAITEYHDIVYREAQDALGKGQTAAETTDQAAKGLAAATPESAPVMAPSQADWSREWVPDDVLLFRYSALTFNGHRIHYDRRYVTQVEGYPGLIVHGPLIATLLMELLREQLPQAQVLSFQFKALRPIFDLHPFRVLGQIQAVASAPGGDSGVVSVGAGSGSRVKLWAADHEGALCMEAMATLR